MLNLKFLSSMYCKQEPDETLIIIKSEWIRQIRDKSLLRDSVTVILDW